MEHLTIMRRHADDVGSYTWASLIAFAILWNLLQSSIALNSAGSIIKAAVLMLFFLAAILPMQVFVKQSYLSRAAWVVMSAYAVWSVWTMFAFYEEAVPHDIVMNDGADRYDPFVAPGWTPVAMWTYYIIGGLLAANLVVSLVFTFRQVLTESRNGLDLSTEDRELSRLDVFLANLFKNDSAGNASSPVAPLKRNDLSTRDTAALKPGLSFRDLSGQEGLKKKLLDAVQLWNNGGNKNGKNGIFLYGPPGTGKTAFAEALAGEMKMRIMKINIGSMASRWINQTTEQMQDIIDSAVRQAPCVLFLDEIESILPDRNRISRADSEESRVVGSFLSSIEKLRNGRVLVIAATNYKDRVDPAAIREGRFDFHIEVGVPDFEARKGLILNALKKAGKSVEPAVLDRLSTRWAGFNVPRIQEAATRAAALASGGMVGMAEFMRGLRDVQGNAGGVPETAIGLQDLYFDDDIKKRLEDLAGTFSMADKIESNGGFVPNGVIFYGPPGTGKTSMAMALAKASGYAFIATNGKEIVSDPERLAAIRRKASDLRPAIVFIDEADDILGDRNMSGMKMHTNELLATIDGVTEPMHDVVWVLATNHIDGFDDAVTRRFPVKIELPVPGLPALTRMVSDWAGRNAEKIHGDVGRWASMVAGSLDGLAPSVVKGILDSAKSARIARNVLRGEAASITLEDVLEARREMRA